MIRGFIISKAAYRPLAVEASVWAFEQITPDFFATPEWQAYFEKYTAGRWVTTAMLKQLWESIRLKTPNKAGMI